MDTIDVFKQALQKVRRAQVRWAVWHARRAGASIGENCSFADVPRFGDLPCLITIGHNVAVAANVSFIARDGGTHVFTQLERYRKVIKYGRITIRDNCVIGERAILLPGVIIGPNSVVAAGSVVARSIPPDVVAAGNPAKPVMTVHQYAEWALAATPDYDEAELARDPKAVLMKTYMRQSVPKRFQQGSWNESSD
jgi:acetyltransferase-like isoleucine patch superfamily enzyme